MFFVCGKDFLLGMRRIVKKRNSSNADNCVGAFFAEGSHCVGRRRGSELCWDSSGEIRGEKWKKWLAEEKHFQLSELPKPGESTSGLLLLSGDPTGHAKHEPITKELFAALYEQWCAVYLLPEHLNKPGHWLLKVC